MSFQCRLLVHVTLSEYIAVGFVAHSPKFL
jgi:hypothetical protein